MANHWVRTEDGTMYKADFGDQELIQFIEDNVWVRGRKYRTRESYIIRTDSIISVCEAPIPVLSEFD